MKLLLGRQIVLKEFPLIDLVISWIEEPVAGALAYLIGSDKGYMYILANSEDIHYGSGLDYLDTIYGKIAVICSDKDLSWKVFKSAKTHEALLAVVFKYLESYDDLFLTKTICWGSSREFNIPVVLIANYKGNLHHQLCVPSQGEDRSGIIFDSTTTCVVEANMFETDDGVMFRIRSFAEG